jgi:hypothetical protein
MRKAAYSNGGLGALQLHVPETACAVCTKDDKIIAGRVRAKPFSSIGRTSAG